MQRDIFEPEHVQFRESVREFLSRHVSPFQDRWNADGIVDRSVYTEAARYGILGFSVPEEFGGAGVNNDFRYNAVVAEECAYASAHGPAFSLQNDIIAPYLLDLTTEEQRRRWLPPFARGELIAAVAMTEPDAGSDLQGIRTHARPAQDGWILNGAKTFISSGIHADLVIVVARTAPEPDAKASSAFTLLAVERGMPGFDRGRKLDKIGLRSQDTAELTFNDVHVPAANVVGEVGRGFIHLMRNLPMERLSIALNAVASCRAVLDMTLDYVKSRRAFGSPIGSFQANKFELATYETEIDIAQVYVDRCITALNAGTLDATGAAKAKWWTTELQQRVVYGCQQMFGGYGYMTEYPIAQAYLDARIQTVYGGSTQIMKELIGRSLGL
ncbi:acyl-CoA dehydrogenase family protein [[Mycobacterium] wendilense]|uniref:Acyl-CoA dehydrogenase family protein n=1 Tax=[Mycobacterium] wendilense TaxID=3064284 RepID=A0ABM9MIJ1_9MYCO|nr:acyl-CoA dehydrogenase family protein [Mycolicibacterium sp. MU0050]CAJ1586043.1 acyl-CoA dehydrogenase family protein [Mycolicibacterium sp. MU0050]